MWRGPELNSYASNMYLSKYQSLETEYWIQSMMVMLYFFHFAGIKSGAMKQAPTRWYNMQNLGSVELAPRSELECKVLPKPSHLGWRKNIWNSNSTRNFNSFSSKQPSLRTGDSPIFVKKCVLFFYRTAEDSSAALHSWFHNSLGVGPLNHEVKNLGWMPHQHKRLCGCICHIQGESLTTNCRLI